MAEKWSPEEVLGAGWHPVDVEWEHETEAVFVRALAGDEEGAKQAASQALRAARASFLSEDGRLGTALANFGWCLARSGNAKAGEDLAKEARRVWSLSDMWIAGLRAPRVARSSLFHMRMEERNRAAYQARWHRQWVELAGEARSRLNGKATPLGPEEALERWRRERPAMLNDTRKLMAAAVLLLVP